MSTPTTERENRSPSPFIQAMTAEQRKDHMRRLGQRGNANRLVLSGEEKAALTEAYRLIERIARRHGLDGEDGGGDAQ